MFVHHIKNDATFAVKRVANDVPPTDFEVPEGYGWLYSLTEAEEIDEEGSWVSQELADALDDGLPF